MPGRMVHIVEPTLATEAGHCHSFVLSVCRAGEAEGLSFRLWCDRGAYLPEIEALGVQVVPHFRRRFRRLQAAFLYRRLLTGPEALFVPTAGRIDLALLGLAARRPIGPGKAFLYFHWLKKPSGKEPFIGRLAASQPDLTVMGPTVTVVDGLRSLGFTDAVQVPYPITPRANARPATPFRWLLSAGAARSDKGFGRIVDLAWHMKSRGLSVPLAVQTSADHYGKYEVDVRSDLARLRQSGYHHLVEMGDVLSKEDYDGIYRGAIVLQPYDRRDFSDRVSGITLDALSLGAPIVVTAGTWMASVAERFGAGVAVEDLSAASLLATAERVRGDFAAYSDRAARAGQVLQAELSARALARVLSSGGPKDPASGAGAR